MEYPISLVDSCKALNHSIGVIILEASYLHGDEVIEINLITETIKSCLTSFISLQSVKKLNSLRTVVKTTLNTVLNIVIASLIYGLMTIVLFPFALLRSIVHLVFYIQGSQCKLMNGADSFWSVEDSTARSIINILCLVQYSHEENDGKDLFQIIKELLKNRLSGEEYFKLWSSREVSLSGYSYWKKNVYSVNDIVQFIDTNITTRDHLEKYLSNIVNKKLNTGFEVHVASNPLDSDNSWPVIFRVHHSVGDGVSLVNALVSSLSDKNAKKPRDIVNLSRHKAPFSGSRFVTNTLCSLPFSVMQLINGPNKIFKRILFPQEVNIFCDQKLSGEKNVLWYVDESGEIFDKVKKMKNNKNVHFSELIFTFISNVFEIAYKEMGKVPQDMSVVVPFINNKNIFTKNTVLNNKGLKITKVTLSHEMANNFSVCLLSLPIESNSNTKLNQVKEAFKESKSSGEVLFFLLLVQVVTLLIPKPIVKPMFNTIKTSLVFSNLPGPNEVISLANNKIQNIAFWLPNRSSNGIGLSILSYHSKLTFGMIADKTVLDKQQLSTIFNNFISSLKNIKA